ncbi:hypothetical protein F511_44644 [Dorcoceras hygrometricum]|uniref:Uncharacterized protein n=1 Tax=Dorcoceras hygrometricum TaxID=472368 RepID=A0A2Z6ZXQ7_9LAMI|nr:hypothetical protein F511_44644 [Dorcoceras hygrometricum]
MRRIPLSDTAPFPPIILSAPATMYRAPPAGPPLGPAGPNLTDLGSNRGHMDEIESREMGAPDKPTTMSPLGTPRTDPSPLEFTMTEALRGESETCQNRESHA